MVNKKGFLKIVEASIAILIILAALVLISSGDNEVIEEDLTYRITPILEEISKNITLRERILNYDIDSPDMETIDDLKAFVGERVTNPYLNYTVEICKIDDVCFTSYPLDIEGNLYSAERVISTSISKDGFSPKKVKVFLWRKRAGN